MPVQAVTHCSPADYRRIAWSMVMTGLTELEQGHQASAEEAAILTAQLTGPQDLALLCSALIDLATVLFAGCHATIAEARDAAAQVALDLACE